MFASILILTYQHDEPLLRLHEKLYLIPLPLVTIYETALHKLLFGERLPFLPLAFTSVYCAIGIAYCWILYYYVYLRSGNDIEAVENKLKRQWSKECDQAILRNR